MLSLEQLAFRRLKTVQTAVKSEKSVWFVFGRGWRVKRYGLVTVADPMHQILEALDLAA
jgi:hypothetical protein